jgi:hypothetical protein
VFIIISYIAGCTYSSLFEIQLGNVIGSYPLFRLLPHQRTDPNSILFSAAYLSRLVSSIALNLLNVINYSSTNPPSPLLIVMQVDPIQDQIYNYSPLILGLICLGTLFNVCYYFHGCISFKSRFQFSEDFNDDQIPQGERIIKQERDANKKNKSTIRRVFQELRKDRNFTRPKFELEGGRDPLESEIQTVTIPVETNSPPASSPTILNSIISFFSQPAPVPSRVESHLSSDDSESSLLEASLISTESKVNIQKKPVFTNSPVSREKEEQNKGGGGGDSSSHSKTSSFKHAFV